MNDSLSLVWMLVVVALSGWLVANALVAFLARWARARDLREERQQLWWLALLPWALPLLSVISLTGLASAKYLGWIDDHCLAHTQHHPHFCLDHLPEILISVPQLFIGWAGIAALLVAVFYKVLTELKQHQRGHLLQQLMSGGGVVKSLKESRPLAFTTGVYAPSIFLSCGIKSLLTKRQQRIVVAHEAAHVRNRDVLKNTLFEVLLSLHLFRSGLRRRWHLNTESLADNAVTHRFDPLEVAEVLIKLERSTITNPYPVSVAGGNFESRVRRLIQPGQSMASGILPHWLLGLIVVMPALLAFHHHSVETLLGWWLAK